MKDFDIENIGLPKLPDDYWQSSEGPAKNDKQKINTIFDTNIDKSLKDISLFKNK